MNNSKLWQAFVCYTFTFNVSYVSYFWWKLVLTLQFPWTQLYFADFVMRVLKTFPNLIQFDKINTSSEQFVIEMRKQQMSIIIQAKDVFVRNERDKNNIINAK